MKEYLLSIYQPDGGAPPPEVLGPVMEKVIALIEESKAAGVWVFNGGLHPPEAATVVRQQHGRAVVTDGPYVESKEHLGGFMVVRVADLDAALSWARRLAEALTIDGHDGLPIEVRPFQEK